MLVIWVKLSWLREIIRGEYFGDVKMKKAKSVRVNWKKKYQDLEVAHNDERRRWLLDFKGMSDKWDVLCKSILRKAYYGLFLILFIFILYVIAILLLQSTITCLSDTKDDLLLANEVIDIMQSNTKFLVSELDNCYTRVDSFGKGWTVALWYNESLVNDDGWSFITCSSDQNISVDGERIYGGESFVGRLTDNHAPVFSNDCCYPSSCVESINNPPVCDCEYLVACSDVVAGVQVEYNPYMWDEPIIKGDGVD